ncbi:hypothetical protein JCM25156A_02340 [Komagataeibacter kakiaceti JCM 25156]
MVRPVFPVLSDTVLGGIISDMNRRGYGVATGCIDPEDLALLRGFIERKVADAGGEYVVFSGRDDTRGTFMETLANAPAFQATCRKLYEAGTGRVAPESTFYQVLRCLSGRSGARHAFLFHYDSFVLTALMPVIMPTEGQKGDLIMLPGMRRIRKTYIGNLIDKVFLDNRITQAIIKKLIFSGKMNYTKVSMVPGNIYFFWGYRIIHANEPCDYDKIRATALFHYGNPHAGSWLRRIMRRTASA